MTSNRHELILASAGTGKTFQLTNRVIALLMRGVDPGEILATTFTRKAAGEIFDRVLDRLSSAAAGEAATLEQLRRDVDHAIDARRSRDVLQVLLGNMHRLNILTIDALFMRLARSSAFDLGVPPGWSIAEDEEDEHNRESAVDRAVEAGDPQRLLSLLQMLSDSGPSSSIRRALLYQVGQCYDVYLQTRDRSEAWERLGPRGYCPTDEEVSCAIEALRSLDPPSSRWGEPTRRNLEAIEQRRWRDALGAGLLKSVLSGNETFYGQAIREPMRAPARLLVQRCVFELARLLKRRNSGIRELLQRFHREYEGLKHATGQLRFDDLPRLLGQDALAHHATELYDRLDRRFNHVLLDEFQDTSVTQFALLEPLLDEIITREDEDRSLFCVGDDKQSLYTWRDAEPRLLRHIGDRWSTVRTSTLTKSYRSARVVLEAVNTVFEGLESNRALLDRPGIAEWAARYEPHHGHSHAHGAFSLRTYPEGGLDDDGVSFVAQRVRELHQSGPRATIGVLTRSNERVSSIIRALARAGMRASGEGGNALTDSPPVAALCSLLKIADHPGDTMARYHVASTALGRVLGLEWRDDDAARRLGSDVRRRLMEDGLPRFLTTLRNELASTMEAHDAERFEQLIRLAYEFEPRATARPTDFVRLIEARQIEDPSSVLIRVMTVHKSKGLEFDAVVLPELDQIWKVNAGVLAGRHGPFGDVHTATVAPGSALRRTHPELDELDRHELERTITEGLCGLYVAMTRARCVAECIIEPGKATQCSAAGVVRAAFDPDGEERAPAGSVLYEVGDPREALHRVAAAARPEPDSVSLRLTRRESRPTWRLGRATPSQLGSGGFGRQMRASDRRAAERGTLLHAWMQHVRWLDDGEPAPDVLRRAAVRLGASEELLQSELRTLQLALGGEHLRACLSRAEYDPWGADELLLHRERPFAVRETQTTGDHVLTGCIDRLVVGLSNGQAEWADVIDFKSDRLERPDQDDLGRVATAYAPQLGAYRRAVCTMYQIPAERVTTRLALLACDRVVEVDDRGRIRTR